MKRTLKAGVYVLILSMMAVTLTGCKIDLAKIGEFITKIADVISKVATGIKSFGENLKKNGVIDLGGVGSDTASIASGTATASDSITINPNDTASGTASQTPKVGRSEAANEEETPGE